MKAGLIDENTFYKVRIYFTTLVLIGIWALLAWSYFHGGVPSHHILADKDLPSFSNWWGGLVLPLLTWFLFYRLNKRIARNKQHDLNPINYQHQIFYGFVGALFFGILLSVFFTFAYTNLAGYLVLLLFPLALLFPIYRAECLLGFVIGMTFTFGGVLPTGIGTIFLAISAVLYLLIRPAFVYIASTVVRVASSPK
ncbi:hypothetical protein [Hymenobacter glaciei]|uniref:hypothetical protein n=1 Tax=Hymenobacter glaciei TaxID=877209 RepID=UPI0031E8DCE5